MRVRTGLLLILIALAGTSVAQPDWTQSEFRSEQFTTSDGVERHFLMSPDVASRCKSYFRRHGNHNCQRR
jgi:hypothetical protein